jgi:hypothetical protein
VNDELSLVNPVADPVETHVHGFGKALLNSIVGYAFSACVVCLDDCGRLQMAEFFEGDADAAGILCNVEQSTEFSFSFGRHDMLDDDTGDVYGAVGECRVGWVMEAARERAYDSDRYDSSLWMVRIMGLAEKRTLASGWVLA